MRQAGRDDEGTLVGLMRGFNEEAGFTLVEPRAAAAFRELLGRPGLGRVWLIEHGGVASGYVVVTFVFAMEYGGTVAIIDDFYVRPEARGKGLGTAALAAVRRACEGLGVRALRVEVGAGNEVARALYRGAGFEFLADRELMHLQIAPPSHAT
jgi:GNAT superfamily N-acetyltransferase